MSAGVVSLKDIAHDPRCENWSGADLAALAIGSAMAAIRESIQAESSVMDLAGPSQTMVLDGVTPSQDQPTEKLYEHKRFEDFHVQARDKHFDY